MDIHAVFFMVKDLFKKLFLHSSKRTFFVVGGLIVMLALPVTLFLTQQSQDTRQRAEAIGSYVHKIDTVGAPLLNTKSAVFRCFNEAGGDPTYYTPTVTGNNNSSTCPERTGVQNTTCSSLQTGIQCVLDCSKLSQKDCSSGGAQNYCFWHPKTSGGSCYSRVAAVQSGGFSGQCGGGSCMNDENCVNDVCLMKLNEPTSTVTSPPQLYQCQTGGGVTEACYNAFDGCPTGWEKSPREPGTTCNPNGQVCCFQKSTTSSPPPATITPYRCGTVSGEVCVNAFSGCGSLGSGYTQSLREPGTSCNTDGQVCCTRSSVTPPTPTATPTLPSVGAVKVFNCEAGLTNPGDIIFGWTRQEWGLNYEVRWGSTQSYSEKLTFGETSQTNVISGFTPGRVVYYSIRAYRGTVAGPSSTGQFTVRTSCPTSGTGGTGVGGSPTQAPAPSPIPGTATQGQTCDNNHFSAEYPGCNTSIKNAEGNSLTCGMYNGMPFGVCNFFTQTACQGGIGSLANGKPCGCPEDCQSGICEQYSGGAVSVSTFCQAPKIPTKPPAPTVAEDPCSVTSNKPANCSCSSSNQCSTNFCDTGSVGRTGTYKCTTPIAESTKPPTPTNSPTPTTRPGLTCDPNKDGKIDTLDFQWLKDEMGGTRTTKVADCFKADGVVNALDFQVWKDINFGKKPAF